MKPAVLRKCQATRRDQIRYQSKKTGLGHGRHDGKGLCKPFHTTNPEEEGIRLTKMSRSVGSCFLEGEHHKRAKDLPISNLHLPT